MIDKKQLLDERPWLQDIKSGKGGVNVVINPDLDGCISGLILTNHNVTIRGIYNNRQLALNKQYRGEDCVFVDCDVARKNVVSIGHHVNSYSENNKSTHLYHPKGVQINDIFGVSVKNKDVKRTFSYKYPFSTAILLLWLLDYNLMDMSKWQRFLILQADGALNNVNNYPHSAKEWMTRMDFLSEPIDSISFRDGMDFNMDFRKLRREHIPTKSNGQGKGIEKTKKIEVVDGNLILPQKNFIKALGDAIGFPYRPERWQCWNDMNLYNFESKHFEKRPVENFKALLKNPEVLSFIFSNTLGRIDYTVGDLQTIERAFGSYHIDTIETPLAA